MGLGRRIRELRFRGKVRLLDRFVRRSGVVSADIFGFDVDLDLANFVDRMIYAGCYEPINVHRFRRLLSAGDVVVDVGANIGFFTLLSSSLVGSSGRVLAVEPHPNNFGILQSSLARNGIKNVTAVPVGLGETAGTGVVEMRNQEDFPNRTASMVPGSGEDKADVVVVTLPQLLADHGIDRVRLVKIDVDGLETAIVRGATDLLQSGAVDYLIVEFNPYWLSTAGTSASDFVAELEAAGMVDGTSQDRLAQWFFGPGEDRLFCRKGLV